MSLELAKVRVGALEAGAPTRLEGDVLHVDTRALAAELRDAVPGLAEVRVHLARPGDRLRIVAVKDAVEPRLKLAGKAPGSGRVLALEGVAVVSCGRVVGYQEGLIDMSGPGAAHSPFSALQLVVLELEPVPGLAPHAHEAVLRAAGLTAAKRLAESARDARPERCEHFALREAPPEPALPRVAYVYGLLAQGLLHDTWVLGTNAREDASLPRIAPPGLAFEGAIVSGNCVSACDKNTTWHHQNHPLLRELFRRDRAGELHFVGMVLTRLATRLAEKEAQARAAVALVRELGADAAIVSKEGFGNPDADQMLLVRGLEAAGVRTATLTDEYAGSDGFSPSLADATPEADAVVSVGNANARIELPPLETLGPVESLDVLAGGGARSRRADGSVEVELQAIVGATNELGERRLGAREV